MIQVNELDVSPPVDSTVTNGPSNPPPVDNSGAESTEDFADASSGVSENEGDDDSNLIAPDLFSFDDFPLEKETAADDDSNGVSHRSENARLRELECGLLQSRKLLEKIMKQRDHYVREYRRVLEERNRYMSMYLPFYSALIHRGHEAVAKLLRQI